MSIGMGQTGSQAASAESAQALAAQHSQQQQQDLIRSDREEDEDQPQPDPGEPPDHEDTGDSESFIEENLPNFEAEERPGSPWLASLPRAVRPRVLFRLTSDGTLDTLGGPHDERRTAIAAAVAKHITESSVVLKQPGDWIHLPCIAGDKTLFLLIPEEQRGRLGLREKLSVEVKGFAIELPSGDVLAVQVLLYEAQKQKKATRAGTLRAIADGKPALLAGEEWLPADWERFRRTQQKKAPRSS